MSKQSTLFETWGNKNAKKKSDGDNRTGFSDVVDLCDSDEDAVLAAVLEASAKEVNTAYSDIGNVQRAGTLELNRETEQQTWSRRKAEKIAQSDQNKTTKSACNSSNFEYGNINPADFETEFDQASETDATNIEDLPGFDQIAGRMWIYPTNYPVREYQYNIVARTLYQNTLVVLPTGLGKTFIAAVVMYNFYRWYPRGKVVFMAPTKPLVAQQIEACYNIMGIPQSDTAEMTGTSLTYQYSFILS